MAKLGIGYQSINYFAGRHLDGGQVMVAVRDRVRNVVKQLSVVVPVVGESLDNLFHDREIQVYIGVT